MVKQKPMMLGYNEEGIKKGAKIIRNIVLGIIGLFLILVLIAGVLL